MYCIGMTATSVHVLFINAVYEVSVGGAVLWLVIYPLYIFYLVYGITCCIVVIIIFSLFSYDIFLVLIGVISFIIMASKFFHIRQQFILKRFSTLNSYFADQVKKKNNFSIIKIWKMFFTTNQQIVGLSRDISQYSIYYSTPLTLMCLVFIAVQCYIVYISIFIQMPFLAKIHGLFMVVEMLLFQYFLLYQCAKVTKCNRAIEKASHQFYFNYCKQSEFETLTNKLFILKVCTIL